MRRKRDLSVSSSSSTTSAPPLRMPTRSASPSMPPRSCVVTKTVMPRSASSPMISSNSALRATTSRPSVGSSRMRSSGDIAVEHACALHRRGAAAPDVLAEKLDHAGGRLLLAEKAADERRLAGAVAAEERVDAAARHAQRDAVDGGLAAVADGQAVDVDDGIGTHALLLFSRPRGW